MSARAANVSVVRPRLGGSSLCADLREIWLRNGGNDSRGQARTVEDEGAILL
jgi:hypothetical protein